MFSDAFGPIWMRLDVFGCNRMHFGALGSVATLLEIFGIFRFFRTILVTFDRFLALGAYFYGRFTYGGAYYYWG